MKRYKLIISAIHAFLLLPISSCGLIDIIYPDDNLPYTLPESYNEFNKTDYIRQYEYLSKTYIEDRRHRFLKLPKWVRLYLHDLTQKLRTNNELIFKERPDIRFYIVDKRSPFYFSTPNGNLFLSLGLIKRYIKNEGSLASIVMYEAIRIEKKIYRKIFVVPTGLVSTERFTALARVDLDQKAKVNKWVYFGLDRAGFDADNYLDWIQLQNKNTLDFSLHLGNMKEIVQEESLLRRFILNEYKGENLKNDTRSSQAFYRFLNYIRSV
jgi:hypothetical protein